MFKLVKKTINKLRLKFNKDKDAESETEILKLYESRNWVKLRNEVLERDKVYYGYDKAMDNVCNLCNTVNISDYHKKLMKVWNMTYDEAKHYGKIRHICSATKNKRIQRKAFYRLGELKNMI